MASAISIFKSYDIRGIYPEELNDEIALKIGEAFVEYTGTKKIAIGYDGRTSGPNLFKSLSEGIISRGADIYDIGQIPTECLYFSVGFYDFDAGIVITASHNPKEYNGFKMIIKKDGFIEMLRGVDLLSKIEVSDYEQKENGKIHKKDIWQDYIKFITKFSGEIKPFKVIIDASNGVVGKTILNIKNSLPIEIIGINITPDCNFPNHSPNPLAEGAIDQISTEVKKQKADFGFIFDADADRIFLIDENGKLVSADITLLVLAKYFLKKDPHSIIAYNAICSRAVPQLIKKWGGSSVRTKVGFVNVREELIKNNGIMGGELSGHYCFRDHFYMDSGIIALLILLQQISSENKKVSKIVEDLSIYYKGDVNFKVKNKEEVLEKIKQKYSDGNQDFLDGITVEYKDWWFNVRPSNTEPLLRLTIEADIEDLLSQKKKELSDFINE